MPPCRYSARVAGGQERWRVGGLSHAPPFGSSSRGARRDGISRLLARNVFLSRGTHSAPIGREQSFLFCARRSFDLQLGGEGLFSAEKSLRPHQFNWSAGVGIALDLAGLMLRQPSIEVVRMARVIRAVSATKNISPKRHRSAPIPRYAISASSMATRGEREESIPPPVPPRCRRNPRNPWLRGNPYRRWRSGYRRRCRAAAARPSPSRRRARH